MEVGDMIQIGPWTYRVCRAQPQDDVDGVLVELEAIKGEGE